MTKKKEELTPAPEVQEEQEEKAVDIVLLPEIIALTIDNPDISQAQVAAKLKVPVASVVKVCTQARYNPAAVRAFHSNKLDVYRYLEATLNQEIIDAIKSRKATGGYYQKLQMCNVVNQIITRMSKSGGGGDNEKSKSFADACKQSMAQEAEED